MKERVNAILTLGASGARVSNGDPGSGFIANVYFCFVSPEMTHSLECEYSDDDVYIS